MDFGSRAFPGPRSVDEPKRRAAEVRFRFVSAKSIQAILRKKDGRPTLEPEDDRPVLMVRQRGTTGAIRIPMGSQMWTGCGHRGPGQSLKLAPEADRNEF
jgi:hypothetical protein